MSTDADAAPLTQPDRKLCILAPLGVERAVFGAPARAGRLPREVEVVQCGPGADNAARAARAAAGRGATACLSFGLAGGLEIAVSPGTILLPRRVIDAGRESFGVCEPWRERLARAVSASLAVDDGDLVSVAGVLTSHRAKARAAIEFSATACDLESAAIARAARETGMSFVAVRVVADGLADELPADVERWVDERGNRVAGRVSAALLRPREWPAIMTAARCFAVARRAMQALVELAGPEAFYFAPPDPRASGDDDP